jgi:hypothetical protein
MKWLWLAAGFVSALLLTDAKAAAMVEPCPAHASVLQPSAKAPGATVFAYTLGALSKRTVDATMIADTNRGWFAWSVAGVPLESVTRTDTAGTFPVKYEAWVSKELSVAIPGDVTVNHAWVTSGSATGDSTFNWGARGTHACDVPGFDAPPSPAPAPPPPLASVAALAADMPVAKATAAPFEIGTCEKPFVPAAIVSGPPLNASALGGQNEGLAAEAAVIDVALDGGGNIVDAWIEASTHSAFDKLAMGGALHTTYRGAVSYCRPAEAIVKYTAWYQPTQ